MPRLNNFIGSGDGSGSGSGYGYGSSVVVMDDDLEPA